MRLRYSLRAARRTGHSGEKAAAAPSSTSARFSNKIGVKRNIAYCASKAAVGAITTLLAVEWADQASRARPWHQGYIVTDLNRKAMTEGPLADYLQKRIPSGRPGTAGDVAKLVAAIFSEDIPFLSGETIYIDGAQGI